jgi:peptidoglycan/xylan/chitin deacetylase (PgdA/CDA1 family)
VVSAAGVLALAAIAVVAVSPAGPAAASTCPSALYGIQRTAPGSGKTVALTFDDGPGRSTAAIMAILAQQHVTATFFNIGVNEKNNASTVLAELHSGYALGDHTWDHTTLTTLDPSGQQGEIDRERSEQTSITGQPPCLLRPPGGSYDATTLQLAQARGMSVWDWSVDTEDWKADGSGAQYWIDRITSRAVAGGDQQHPVILMHNQPGGNPATVAAVPQIIAYYKAHGYAFVDLLGRQLDVPAQPFHYGSTYLTPGQRLRPGQVLVSADHLSELQMAVDGNLVLWHTGGGRTARYVIWQSRTSTAHSYLIVEPSGDLVIRAPSGQGMWHTGTQGSGGRARLTLFSNGNLWLTQPGKILWQTHTVRYTAPSTVAPRPFPAGPSVLTAGHELAAGRALVAANRLTQLRMQTDGNLVLYRTGDSSDVDWVLWASGTRSPNAHLTLAADGDLAIVSTAGHIVWAAHTAHEGASPHLAVLSIGSAMVIAGGHSAWQTHTGYFIA